MTTRKSRQSAALVRQSTELALAAPQVVAHRVARMAMSGPRPSARDQKEFTGMVVEKQVAFAQAWTEMIMRAAMSGPSLYLAAMQAWSAPWTPARSMGKPFLAQWQNATLGVLNAGMAPVRKKAVANARRLSRR